MSESYSRMTNPENPPSDSAVAEWIGKDAYCYWERIKQLIEQMYPSVFTPEWLFGGKKHGWGLRYKKTKLFCTLIPEKNRFALLIVFGAKEREKMEVIRDSLSQYTRKEYDEAKIVHDGKWVRFKIDSEDVVKDVLTLLALKRRPEKKEKQHH